MKLVITRVKEAKVVGEEKSNEINFGLLILVGVLGVDTPEIVKNIAEKIANLRIFEDENGKTNKNILEVGGEVLCVPNFTLAATLDGNRPSFSNGAKKEQALELFELFCAEILKNGVKIVKTGFFGEYMELSSKNDGPFTIVYEN
jgi:D-tyrosyl-tRNA(Tyr) deacylase